MAGASQVELLPCSHLGNCIAPGKCNQEGNGLAMQPLNKQSVTWDGDGSIDSPTALALVHGLQSVVDARHSLGHLSANDVGAENGGHVALPGVAPNVCEDGVATVQTENCSVPARRAWSAQLYWYSCCSCLR